MTFNERNAIRDGVRQLPVLYRTHSVARSRINACLRTLNIDPDHLFID
tara:strand:+ start:1727 stop:1870 length:144 start_codon:yes stop_codon:yes gene_type:complete